MSDLRKPYETYPATAASKELTGEWVRVKWERLRLGARRVFIISDQHINHYNIHEYCGRTEDWYEKVCSNWKRYVNDCDLVLDLGDVIFKDASQLGTKLKNLPGTKILVRGNHDGRNAHWYLEQGYSFVCDQLRFGPVLFKHEPIAALYGGVELCVHGHLHNSQWSEAYWSTAHFNQLYAVEFEPRSPMLLYDFLRAHGRLQGVTPHSDVQEKSSHLSRSAKKRLLKQGRAEVGNGSRTQEEPEDVKIEAKPSP